MGGTKTPDIAKIRALRPDLVHLNSEENLQRHALKIQEFAPIHLSEPKSVADVGSLITALGEMYGRRDEALGMNGRLRDAISRAAGAPFTFACPIWKEPWMWCGGDTYVSSLVQMAGGRNVLRSRLRYPVIPLEEIAALRPEIIFLPDEPYLFSPEDAAEVSHATGAKVTGPFPGHLFTWHGARTILGLEFLAEILRNRDF